MPTVDEVASLMAENAALRAKLLDATNPDPMKAVWPQNFAAPSDADLAALMAIVQRECVLFRCKDATKQKENLALFKIGFAATARLPRQDGLNLKIHPLSFSNRAEEALLSLGFKSPEVPLGTLLAVCIAHSDIEFSPLANFPHDVALGLANYDGRMPTGAGWKHVLSAGKVRLPTALPTTEAQRVSQMQMRPRITSEHTPMWAPRSDATPPLR